MSLASTCPGFRPHPWRKGVCIDCFCQETTHEVKAKRKTVSSAYSSSPERDFPDGRTGALERRKKTGPLNCPSKRRPSTPLPLLAHDGRQGNDGSRYGSRQSTSESTSSKRRPTDVESGYDSVPGTQHNSPASVRRKSSWPRVADIISDAGEDECPDLMGMAIDGEKVVLVNRRDSIISVTTKTTPTVSVTDGSNSSCTSSIRADGPDSPNQMTVLEKTEDLSQTTTETAVGRNHTTVEKLESLTRITLERKEGVGLPPMARTAKTRADDLTQSFLERAECSTRAESTESFILEREDSRTSHKSSETPSKTPMNLKRAGSLDECKLERKESRTNLNRKNSIGHAPPKRIDILTPVSGSAVSARRANSDRKYGARNTAPELLPMMPESEFVYVPARRVLSLCSSSSTGNRSSLNGESSLDMHRLTTPQSSVPGEDSSTSSTPGGSQRGSLTDKTSLKRVIRTVFNMNRRKDIAKYIMSLSMQSKMSSGNNSHALASLPRRRLSSSDSIEQRRVTSKFDSDTSSHESGASTPCLIRPCQLTPVSSHSDIPALSRESSPAIARQLCIDEWEDSFRGSISTKQSLEFSPKASQLTPRQTNLRRSLSDDICNLSEDQPDFYPSNSFRQHTMENSSRVSSAAKIKGQSGNDHPMQPMAINPKLDINPVINPELSSLSGGLHAVWEQGLSISRRGMPEDLARCVSDWTHLDLIGYDAGQFPTTTLAHFSHVMNNTVRSFSLEIEMMVSLKRTKGAGVARDAMIREVMTPHFNVLRPCGKVIQRLPLEIECKMNMATSDCISHTCYITDSLANYVGGYDFVATHLEGKRLQDLEGRVTLILLQLLLALEHARSFGIVHRHVDLDKMLIGNVDGLAGDRLLLTGFEYALSAASDKKIKVEPTSHPPPEWFVYDVNDLMYLGCNIDHLPPEIIGLCDSSPQLDFSCVDTYAVGVFLSELLTVFPDNYPSFLRYMCKAMVAPAPSIRMSLTRARRVIECYLWGPGCWLESRPTSTTSLPASIGGDTCSHSQPRANVVVNSVSSNSGVGNNSVNNTDSEPMVDLCRSSIKPWLMQRKGKVLSSIAVRSMTGQLTIADMLHARFLSSVRCSDLLYSGEWLRQLVCAGEIIGKRW